MTEKHWERAKLNVTLIFCSVCLHVCIVCIYQANTTTVEAGAQMLAWLLCCLVRCLAWRTTPVSGAQEHTRCPYTTWLWCWKLWPTCQWKHQSRVITEQRKTSQQGNSHQSKTQQRTSLAASWRHSRVCVIRWDWWGRWTVVRSSYGDNISNWESQKSTIQTN